jgi:cation transport ATPase
MNSTPLADLCLVDSVIFDKTGTMTIPQFKIKLLLINETFFEIHHKTFKN